jgi:two-component system invasion response regulator UvrY
MVEDNEDMRFILKRLIKKNFKSVTSIKESDTAEKALLEIPIFKPDLVLVDISLPGMNGIELIRMLKGKSSCTCILVVTGHEIELYKQAALDAGAHDIISKSEDEKLIRVIGELKKRGEEGRCENR